MSQPKPQIFIPEVSMLKLSTVHYKAMVAEQNVVICQRNLQDAQVKFAEMKAKHTTVVSSIGAELGVNLLGWDENTGEANYEELLVIPAPAPVMPEPAVEPAPDMPDWMPCQEYDPEFADDEEPLL